MPAHTAPVSFTDTTYAISEDLPSSYDASGYGATTVVFTNIGQVESFPEFGLEQALNEFNPISGDTTYVKGTKKYGQGPMMMADIPADAGQIIAKAASESNNHYSMKITYPDGEIHYLDVLIAGWKLAAGGEGQVMKRSATVGVCRAPVVVAAS
ncbi:MAG: phage tail tube protein [Pseudohongiellaceae bacterium]|nr:phage tail tube protein [Pseudohongiellaceae bacterium]